jgi:hypothetical protein
MYYVKKLGYFNTVINTSIGTGIKAPVAGTYVAEVEVLGHVKAVEIEVENVGDEIAIPNEFNENSTVQFRVKLPEDYLETFEGNPLNSGMNYITTREGEIAFEFVNRPS